MYSKEEAQEIRKKFWTQFGQTHSRKWILYHTNIKDFSFKFYADTKKVEVSLDIECKNPETRFLYYQKITSLQKILKEEYLSEAEFQPEYILENGKAISRIWVTLENVSINNPRTWEEIFEFFFEKMNAFECFFFEYEDYIRDLGLNA